MTTSYQISNNILDKKDELQQLIDDGIEPSLEQAIEILSLQSDLTKNLKRLRLPQVIEKTGWKRPTIYKKIAQGTFPKQRKDGRTSYWFEHEINDWIASRA